ncbi:MAG: hypothetical protein GC150_15440 [Rhizobiales bacterium]|nr:hypothetical protein [Hyphomicrobiales bacterium]
MFSLALDWTEEDRRHEAPVDPFWSLKRLMALFLFLALIVLIFLLEPALAQAAGGVAATGQTTIVLGPIMQELIGLAASAVTIAVAIGLAWLKRSLRISEESQLGAILDRAARAAITLATHKAMELGQNIDTVTVQRSILADAAAYLADRTPEALKRFGLTPARLEDYLRARLDLPLGDVVVSAARSEPAA